MKKFVPFFLAAAFLLSLSVAASAQRVGGYSATDKDSAAVQEAATFAVEAQAEKTSKEMSLDEVLMAEVQVVAGRNYRVCMRVNSEGGEGQDDVSLIIQAIVYVDLKGNKKLSSWEISKCGE